MTRPEESREPAERTRQPLNLTAGQVLLAAVVAGVLAAFGELALQWARQYRGVAVINESPHVAWMTPLGSVAAFLAVGLLLVLAGMLTRRLSRSDGVAFVFAFLACASVFTVIPTLHMAAAGLLAAGVAWQISRWVGAHGRTALRGLAAAGAWLVPLAIGLGIGSDLLRRVSEVRAVAALPEPAGRTPNVLLLILDTVRGENLSLHGYERETTPELEALAAESVVFDRAIAPAPWTLPTHASMFTGHWPHRISADWLDPLDEAQPVLAEALAGLGYATGGFVANLVYTHRGWGLARGFTHYEDFPVTPGQVVNSFSLGRIVSNLGPVRWAAGYHDVLNRKPAESLNRSLLRWIDGVRDARPFFAFVNYFDAHEPLFPPAPWDTLFGPAGIVGPFEYSAEKVVPRDRYAWGPERIAAEQDAYDGAIAYLDHSIRALLDALEQRGLLDSTLVIVTSDHGEQFGEHGLLAHGNSVYPEVVRVPLLVRLPGTVPAGVRVSQNVTLVELPATVMGIVAAGDTTFPGASLGRFWSSHRRPFPDTIIAEVTGGFSESDVEPIAAGDVRSVYVDRWHYILNGDGGEELYDISEDPWEVRNLASEPAHATRLEAMRAAFEAEWQDAGKRPRLRR